MFYIRIFSFSTGLAPNHQDCIRFLVRLWLSYGSLIVPPRSSAAESRFETMETHIKSLTDLVGSLTDNNNKRKYDKEDNEKRRKKTRTYVERQNLPQSSKKHEVSEISEDDEISAVTRPYGISDSEQPDDVVSIPDQRTMRQQIQDLCGKVNNDQALADDLDLIQI